jgi:mRNA interferase MazF
MEMVSYPRRDEVWLIGLDPSRGSEIKKTRPCLVVSPDEMNQPLQTVVVAPMTTTVRTYPTRLNLTFRGKTGRLPWINCELWTASAWCGGSARLRPRLQPMFREY